jgi:hypothetical protein
MHQRFWTRGDRDKSGRRAACFPGSAVGLGDDGGRHRRLIGGCEVFAADTPEYQGSRYGPVRRITSRRVSAIEGHFAGRTCEKQN